VDFASGGRLLDLTSADLKDPSRVLVSQYVRVVLVQKQREVLLSIVQVARRELNRVGRIHRSQTQARLHRSQLPSIPNARDGKGLMVFAIAHGWAQAGSGSRTVRLHTLAREAVSDLHWAKIGICGLASRSASVAELAVVSVDLP
jgi:hypothetical protein